MKFVSIFLLCLLSACAENPGKVLYEGLMGKSIYYADEKFGEPKNIQKYVDDPNEGPIYFAEWRAHGTKTISVPNTQTTFGQFGGQYFNATTYGSQSHIIQASCDLKIYYPRKTKIIGHVEASGNACEFYANR